MIDVNQTPAKQPTAAGTLVSSAAASGSTVYLIKKLGDPSNSSTELKLSNLTTPSTRGKAIIAQEARVPETSKPSALDLGLETSVILVATAAYSAYSGFLGVVGKLTTPENSQSRNQYRMLTRITVDNLDKFGSDKDAAKFFAKSVAIGGVLTPLVVSAVCRFAPSVALPDLSQNILFGLGTAIAATTVTNKLAAPPLKNITKHAALIKNTWEKVKNVTVSTAFNLGLWAVHAAQGWETATAAAVVLSTATAVITGAAYAIALRANTKLINASGLNPQEYAEKTGLDSTKDSALLSVNEGNEIKESLKARECHFFGMETGKAERFGVAHEYKLVQQFFTRVIDRLSDPKVLTTEERDFVIQVIDAAIKLNEVREREIGERIAERNPGLKAKLLAAAMKHSSLKRPA